MSTSPRGDSTEQEVSRTMFSFIQNAPLKGVASLVLAVAGLVSMFVGVILLIFITELRGSGLLAIVLGGIFLTVAVMVSLNSILQSIAGRRGRYGANTVVMMVAFLTLSVLIYVFGTNASARWDVTATRQFSLAPHTLQILENLGESIEVTAFFVPDDPNQEPYRIPSENLLNEFKHRSEGLFEYRFSDPDREPALANRYRITEYPSIVFEGTKSGLRHRLTAPLFEERDISSALLIVTGQERKQIFYLTGHGELDLSDVEPDSRGGFANARMGMNNDNYNVFPLSLIQNSEIPETTAVIIVAGPTRDLSNKEFELLSEYLRLGGRMLLLLEPNPPQTFRDLLAQWAITVEEGTIVDIGSSLAGQPQTVLIQSPQYNDQEPVDAITALVEQNYFVGATSIVPSLPREELPSTIELYPVATSTMLSCMTLDEKINDCPNADYRVRIPAFAMQGIAPINANPDPKAKSQTKMVILGDRDFATNFHINSVGNRDLLLNSVNWLAEDYALASVRSKPIALRRLIVTGREMQLIRGMSWFVLPVLMAFLAGVAWWRRR
ncbi:MAG: ABC-type uncharacterized transport system involved in gliding motility, auxiliary component [Chloroflexi bacterium]|nr:MAG: ABC-type uncharacterized transport system involved in gliding motility, auxiliary component [Chloroflexota bacterium]